MTITATSGGRSTSVTLTLIGQPTAGKRITDFLDAANSYGSSASQATVRIVDRSGVAVLQRFTTGSSVLQELLLADVTVPQALTSLDAYQAAPGRNPTSTGGARFYSTGPLVAGSSALGLLVD